MSALVLPSPARGRRTRRRITTAVLLATTVVTAAACGGGTGTPTASGPASTLVTAGPPMPAATRAELSALADQLLASTGATGGIVALAADGAAPLVVPFGAEPGADGGTGRAITADAPLPVASVMKSYVAALALTLAADGTVDLDAPISTWLDWPGGDELTLRQLLTHTSGLGRFGDGESPFPFLDLVAAGEPVDLDQALAAARAVPPVGEPGGPTRYGNLNYLVAGAVLQAAADRPLTDLLEERLFAPLGLADTSYPAPGDDPATPVGLYELEPGAAPVPTTAIPLEAWRTAMGPSSGAVSTAADLLRWAAVLHDGRVGDVDLSTMTEIGSGGYGLGVIGVGPDGDCVFDGCPPGADFDRWALNGDFPGASTRVLHDPASATTLVVFLNRNALDLDADLIAFLDTVT